MQKCKLKRIFLCFNIIVKIKAIKLKIRTKTSLAMNSEIFPGNLMLAYDFGNLNSAGLKYLNFPLIAVTM